MSYIKTGGDYFFALLPIWLLPPQIGSDHVEFLHKSRHGADSCETVLKTQSQEPSMTAAVGPNSSQKITLTDAKNITDAGLSSTDTRQKELGRQVNDSYQKLSSSPSKENGDAYLQNLLGLANDLKGSLTKDDAEAIKQAGRAALEGAHLSRDDIEALIPSKTASAP